jgi:predicted HTH transcriptional regulator
MFWTSRVVELAKDVAAFANADGGVLLIGAYEDTRHGVLGTYKALDAQAVKLARESYSQAVRSFCFPSPIIDSVVVPHGNGSVVAVNVWPFPGQAVGVRSREHIDAYFFPFRSGRG